MKSHEEYAEDQRRKIAALDEVNPQVVRIANASRVCELQLIIAQAIYLVETKRYDEAVSLMESARPVPRGQRHRTIALDDARLDARAGIPDQR